MLKKLCLMPTERTPQEHDLTLKLDVLLGRPLPEPEPEPRIYTELTRLDLELMRESWDEALRELWDEAPRFQGRLPQASDFITVTPMPPSEAHYYIHEGSVEGSVGVVPLFEESNPETLISFTQESYDTSWDARTGSTNSGLLRSIDTIVSPTLPQGYPISRQIIMPDVHISANAAQGFAVEIQRGLRDEADFEMERRYVEELTRHVIGERPPDHLYGGGWYVLGSPASYADMLRSQHRYDFTTAFINLPISNSLIAVRSLGTLTRTQTVVQHVRSNTTADHTFLLNLSVQFDLSNIEAYTLQY